MKQRVVPLLGAFLIAAIVIGLLPGNAYAGTSYDSEEIAVVRLINEYRVSKGLSALLVSDILSDSSAKHSHDMGAYSFFAHVTVGSDWFPVGATAGERMVACGYPANKAWGENIAVGFSSAATVFEAWKGSPSHNANMLSASWEVIGIGFETVPGSSGGTYWTTDFGSYVDGSAHENGQPLPADTTAPTVTITFPAAGQDVSGSVTVCVTAIDNRGVTQVDLYANGAKVATDDASPYAVVWDTSGLNPGTYAIEVRATDAAGNVGSASRAVHVSGAPGASTTTTTTTTSTTTSTTTTTTSTTSTTTSTTEVGSSFADVPAGSRFCEPITILAAAGVVNGYSDRMFYPDNPVTRAQFTKIIMLALNEHTAEIENVSDPTFADVRYTGSAYPFDYVEEAAWLNIIKGYVDGSFAPAANVTRLQVALMLVRAGGENLAEPPAAYLFPFVDVPAYAKEAVGVAHYNGLLSGKTATKFDPYSSATRGQVAKMVYGLIEALRP
jgi:uncharacterized protein YkwD